MVTSEVILHFENRWESDSANQDYGGCGRISQTQDFKKFMFVGAL